MQTELYKPKALFAMGGATLAVTVFCAAFGNAFNFNPKWLALLVAEILAFGGGLRIPPTKRDRWWGLVAFFNGCLLYCQSIGINSINNGAAKNAQGQRTNASQAAIISLAGSKAWWPPAYLTVLADDALNLAAQTKFSVQATSDVAQRLTNLIPTLQSRGSELERHLQEDLSNINATQRGIQSGSQKEREYLTKHLEELQQDVQATKNRIT